MIFRIIILTLVCCVSTIAGSVERTTRNLFDGKTFNGWEGNTDQFRIVDGSIVGGSLTKQIAKNEFLCTAEEFGDFELRLEFRVLGKSPNAGIQIRSQRIPNSHAVTGYQADIGQIFWGCLYDESRRNKVLAQTSDRNALMEKINKDGWNRYKIRCEGPRIRLWINDVATIDYTEQDIQIPLKGIIGLQIHSGLPSEAWYRNIEIDTW